METNRGQEFRFTPSVEAVLRSRGWTPDRWIDFSKTIGLLESTGYVASSAARRILGNLGGLVVDPVQLPGRAYSPSRVEFDPLSAAGGERDKVRWWEEEYGLSLFPLGTCASYAILMVAPDGRLFAAPDWRFDAVGTDIADAMGVLLLATRRPIKWDMGRRVEVAQIVGGIDPAHPEQRLRALEDTLKRQAHAKAVQIERRPRDHELLIKMTFEGALGERAEQWSRDAITNCLSDISLTPTLARVRLQSVLVSE